MIGSQVAIRIPSFYFSIGLVSHRDLAGNYPAALRRSAIILSPSVTIDGRQQTAHLLELA
jgi:hypothetical protein